MLQKVSRNQHELRNRLALVAVLFSWQQRSAEIELSPRVVDSKLRGIEQKLRDDAKAFQVRIQRLGAVRT